MRLSFGNGEHDDFVVDGGVISLGNALGNTLVLPARDVAAWHARVSVDPRGIVLEVLDQSAQTHVNARPVREKALLRCGDLLCLGRIPITLKPDRDDVISTTIPADAPLQAPPSSPARVVLRGVSGSHFGKVIAVDQRLVVGSSPQCGLVIEEARVARRHASIENVGDAIWLRNIDSSDGTFVNGILVRNAVIHPGDQLAFEHSHFIVEAPGLPLRGEDQAGVAHAITETMDVVPITSSSSAAVTGQRAIGWLIGAAALIALGLSLLIHRGM